MAESELTRFTPSWEATLSLLLNDWLDMLSSRSEEPVSPLSDKLWEAVWLAASDWEAREADKEVEIEALSDREADFESCSEAEIDWLLDKDSFKEVSEVWLNAVSDDSWLFTWLSWTPDTEPILPITAESDATKRSALAPAWLSKTGPSVTSSAWVTWVTTAPPSKAPVASTPLRSECPEKADESTSTCRVLIEGKSTPPLSTLKRPKFEVAARSQCLPDFTSLKRVTRSVSRYWPSFLLKNILTPLIFWLKYSF